MLALDKRHLLIIKILINATQPLSSEVLASVLGTTSRTVRTDLKVIEQILQRVGARVVSKSGTGYSLEIVHEGEFYVFLQSFNEKYSDSASIPQYNMERIRLILHQLLFQDGYIKSELFLDQFFISRTTLSLDLRRVRQLLNQYHLDLEQKPSYGLKVAGKERHWRVAQADYMNVDEEGLYFNPSLGFEVDAKVCRDQLKKFLLRTSIHVSVFSLEELIHLLQVMELRIRQQHFICFGEVELEEIKAYEEFETVQEFLEELLPQVTIHDVADFTLHIVSRRILSTEDAFDLNQNKSTYFLGDEMLKFLFIYTNVDFSFDWEIRQLMTRELRGMLVRLRYGYEYRNGSMVDVKQNNAAFEYAVIMCDYLSKKYGYTIIEEEIAIIASILHYSLITHLQSVKKQDVCLVWSRGRNEALIPRQKILDYFGRYVSFVDLKEPYELKDTNYHPNRFIITDMPKSHFPNFENVFTVMNNFNVVEQRKISHYLSQKEQKLELLLKSFHQSCFVTQMEQESRFDVISTLATCMEQHAKVTAGFSQMVCHREKISSTERGNNIAIAHSLFPAAEKTVIGIGILKHPIVWDQELVQVVFMVANGKEESQMFLIIQWLQTLIKQMDFVHELLMEQDFKKVIQTVRKAFLLADIT